MLRLFALLLLAAPIQAQISHYGSWPVTDKEIQELGIESFSLSGEGARGEPGYVATAEVFGQEGKYLATCEIEWHKAKATTCTFEDGEILRFRTEGYSMVLEDLRTGEAVTVVAKAPQKRGAPPGFAFEGEMKKDWEERFGFIGAVAREAVLMLFGSEGTSFDFPREKVTLPDPPDQAITCPGDSEALCASPPIFVSAFHVLGGPECCRDVTATLDVTCRFYTAGYSCCRQTACFHECGLPPVLFCVCNREGWHEICASCGPDGPLQ